MDLSSVLFHNLAPGIYYPGAASCSLALSAKIVDAIGIKEQIGFGLKALLKVEEAEQMEVQWVTELDWVPRFHCCRKIIHRYCIPRAAASTSRATHLALAGRSSHIGIFCHSW